MKKFQIGLVFLILFCFFRPFALLDTNILLGGLNFFELFAIILSYLMFIIIFINIKKIKLDLISALILLFCYYCGISVAWGSEVRIITQVTFPFILFFAVRVIISKPEDIKLLLSVLLIAYCFLLLASLYQIIQGTSIQTVESVTGIERHAGLFKGVKLLAFTMFFFSVFYYMQVIINQLKRKEIKWILFSLLIISFFSTLKSYARTAILGLVIFWLISLWGYNRKYFSIVLALSLIFGFIFIEPLEQFLYKTPKFDINVASSGRDVVWEHNINFFLESSFFRQFVGNGFGVVSSTVIGTPSEIWSSHNDYLHLLMALGGIGLVLYLMIYFVMLKDIYMSNLNERTKFFYYGLILSISAMNFGSGVILYQFGISQQFWMIMGFLYAFIDFNATSHKSI